MARLTVPIQINALEMAKEHSKEFYEKGYQQGRADGKAEGRAAIIDEILAIKNPCDDCYNGFCESCSHNGGYALAIQEKLERLKEMKND